MINSCPTCRVAFKVDRDPECETCSRRRRYGAIVQALTVESDEPPFSRSTLDALDALADVMRDRHRLIRQHQRELIDEQRGAQRDANYAHAEGYAEGRSSREEW